MSGRDYEQLTLFPADSHVSRSLLPGSKEARQTTVSSGQRCAELLKSYSPLGCLARMCLESSIWHSTRSFLTWKASGIPHRRLLFRLAVSTLRIKESASLFWPTPSTGAALCAGTGSFKTLHKMAEKGLISEEERRQLSQGNGGKTNPGLLEWLMGYEQAFTMLLPTPTATDYKGGITSRWYPANNVRKISLGGGVHHSTYVGLLREFLECTPLGKIGLVNPTYLEWLMGYPIGWTELSASETQ